MSARPALVQLVETREVFSAELIALRLRDAGIDAQVLDQSFRQEPLPSVRAFAVVRVLVPAEQAEAARRLLEADRPLPEDVELAADDAGVDATESAAENTNEEEEP
jgi:hypothetical protein